MSKPLYFTACLQRILDYNPLNMSSNQKRLALVTGGNRGIGFEVCRQLGKKGLHVLLGSRDAKRGEEAATRLRKEGLAVDPIACDVTQLASLAAVVDEIEKRFHRLDILVNNAGIMLDGAISILDLPLEAIQQTMQTNSFGAFVLSQRAIPLMLKNDYGRIVNMSSTLGSLGDMSNPESDLDGVLAPAYRLSKVTLNGVTAVFARELRDTNIIINSMCPGWVKTDMGGDEAPVSPEQAADTAVWLATLPDNGPRGQFIRERKPLPW